MHMPVCVRVTNKVPTLVILYIFVKIKLITYTVNKVVEGSSGESVMAICFQKIA